MKLKISVKTNLKIKEVNDKVNRAAEGGLKDVIVDIAHDTMKGSPILSGNNRRSIKYDSKGLSGSVYSTSGYGGWLEIGTSKMSARPYFMPAYNRHSKELPKRIKRRLK